MIDKNYDCLFCLELYEIHLKKTKLNVVNVENGVTINVLVTAAKVNLSVIFVCN